MTGTFLLGTMYEEGLGVTQDITRAVELYEQAAQIDHLYALLNLARIYRNGKGVAVDLSRAEQWYRRIIAIGAELDPSVEAEIKEANDFISA
jgi:TPR repeat protein